MLAPFLALTRKDLKLFFRNRRALLMTVAAPIAIGSFFGYIFGPAPRPSPAASPCWPWTRTAARSRARSPPP